MQPQRSCCSTLRWLILFSLDPMRLVGIALFVAISIAVAHQESHSFPSSEILDFIRSAQDVYVFPYTVSEHPKMDWTHSRLLDRSPRESLKRILCDSRNYFYGFYNQGEVVGDRGIGLCFRRERQALVLFFYYGSITAQFRGHSYAGGFDDTGPRRGELQRWIHRYARAELEGKWGLTKR